MDDTMRAGEFAETTGTEDFRLIGDGAVACFHAGSFAEATRLAAAIGEIDGIEEHRPDIVGMSALLTTTMPHMREAVRAVKATGVETKIVIGGAPVTEEFAREVEADGFAADAGAAADVARALLGAA